MKNLLILALLTVFLNADNNKTMSKQEFLKYMQESQQRQEKDLAEIEKTKKFIQKLELMKMKLEAEKLESEQTENKK
jgi:hypothetical protein